MQKIALGTANFGSNYGIANQDGKLSEDGIAKIMQVAFESGIQTLDTASGYGDCLEVLGRIGTCGWEIVSKVSAIPDDCEDVSRLVVEQFETTLEKLRVQRINGLLLHNAKDLLGAHGDEIFSCISGFRSRRLVSKVGVSIYDSTQLEAITQRYEIDLVQAPINVFDNQINESGWLDRMETSGIEFHARSIFLQGLLLSPEIQMKPFFSQWRDVFCDFNNWVALSRESALDKCLSHVRSFQKIACIVVGVDSVEQISDVVKAINLKPQRAPSFSSPDFRALINPSLWVLE